MESVILEISLCLIENIIIYVFFNSLLKSRFKSVLPLIIAIISSTMLGFICTNLMTALKILISFLFLSICVSVLYKDRFIIKITYALMSLYLLSIVDIILGNIFSLILAKDITNIFFTDLLHRFIFSLIIKSIDTLVSWYFIKCSKELITISEANFGLCSRLWSLFFLQLLLYFYTSTQARNKTPQVQLCILHCQFCFLR